MAGEKKFFVGVGGNQTGPFTEEEILQRIGSGEYRGDALVWYEGLAEWQRLDTVVYFQGALKDRKNAVPLLAEEPNLRPVFSAEEAVFFRRKSPRSSVLVIGVVVLAFGLLGFWLLEGAEDSLLGSLPAAIRKKDSTSRKGRLEKADSDSLLNPTVIPEDFLKLVEENAGDDVGLKAASQLEALYKKKQRWMDLAALYTKLGHPWDAVPLFVQEKAFPEAEQAAFASYEKSADTVVRKQMLQKSIELLTGPLANVPAAVERLKIFEKEFPGEWHPFGYYLLNDEKKIADIFERTSLFFVDSLLTHIKAEFPQLRLLSRPLVSVVKESADRYRIIGTYSGEVLLSQDRLKGIRFEYWFISPDWKLVATNVTAERKNWARTNRERFLASAYDAKSMLGYVESVMRSRFPSLGIHERVTAENLATASREAASQSRP